MPEVLVSRKSNALWLRLQRPEHGNALAPSTLDAFAAALDGLSDNDRALVVTGSYGVFCSGADVRAARSMLDDERSLLAFMDQAQVLLDHLESLPVPTVAAVNGLAMAGGLELALACDLIIAADDARIGDGHTAHGIVPAWGATARLPRRVGRGMATWLFASSRSMAASDLVACGLVDEAVPLGELEGRVCQLLDQLGDVQPMALSESLHLARRADSRSLDDALRAERYAFQRQLRRAELRDGVDTF